MAEPCGALIIDDDEDMALLIATAIGIADDGLFVAGVAHSGEHAMRILPETDPDVVVLDFRMPGRNGLEVAADILAVDPTTKIVLFSAYLDGATTAEAARLGVKECVSKDDLWSLPLVLKRHCAAA